MLENKIS